MREGFRKQIHSAYCSKKIGDVAVVLYGTVFKEDAAIKMIKGRRVDQEEALLKEMAILERARTEYVVRFLGYCICPDGILLAMEFMSGGTLSQALRRDEEFQWYNRCISCFCAKQNTRRICGLRSGASTKLIPPYFAIFDYHCFANHPADNTCLILQVTYSAKWLVGCTVLWKDKRIWNRFGRFTTICSPLDKAINFLHVRSSKILPKCIKE